MSQEKSSFPPVKLASAREVSEARSVKDVSFGVGLHWAGGKKPKASTWLVLQDEGHKGKNLKQNFITKENERFMSLKRCGAPGRIPATTTTTTTTTTTRLR